MSNAKEIENMTPLEAVAELREYDHAFISAKGVAAFNKAFGVKVRPVKYRANPRDPKGLTLNDGAKEAVGLCAATYAEEASAALKTGFEPWQSGRGFRLASACDAIEKHLRGA